RKAELPCGARPEGAMLDGVDAHAVPACIYQRLQGGAGDNVDSAAEVILEPRANGKLRQAIAVDVAQIDLVPEPRVAFPRRRLGLRFDVQAAREPALHCVPCVPFDASPRDGHAVAPEWRAINDQRWRAVGTPPASREVGAADDGNGSGLGVRLVGG